MKLFKDKQEAIEFKTTHRQLEAMERDITILNEVIGGLFGLEMRLYKKGNYGKQTIPRDCRFYLESMREYLIEVRRKEK